MNLSQNDVYSLQRYSGRDGWFWFVLSRSTFDLHWHGVWRLLYLWGGEAIYWGNGDQEDPYFDLLASIGTPTVLAVDVLMDPDRNEPCVNSGLLRHFVARRLGLDYCGEGRTASALNAGQIADAWQPGCRKFDQSPGLLKAIATARSSL